MRGKHYFATWYLERLPVLQEQNSQKSITLLLLEKTTIYLNVSVPRATWMPEASDLLLQELFFWC